MRHSDEKQIECVPHSFNMLAYCEITKAKMRRVSPEIDIIEAGWVIIEIDVSSSMCS